MSDYEAAVNSVLITVLAVGMGIAYGAGYVPFQDAAMTQLVIITTGVFLYGERLKEEDDE